jgi:hypothetical protein
MTLRKLLLGTAIVFTMLSPAIAATMMDEGEVTAEMRDTTVCIGEVNGIRAGLYIQTPLGVTVCQTTSQKLRDKITAVCDRGECLIEGKSKTARCIHGDDNECVEITKITHIQKLEETK